MKFGTSPISDAYFKLISAEEEDKMIREMMISSSCKVEEVPFEEFEGIGIDMSGPEPIYSKGWREFFKWEM